MSASGLASHTLTPVTRYALNVPDAAVTVDTDKISLRGSACAVATGNAYGNDDSVYITTERPWCSYPTA